MLIILSPSKTLDYSTPVRLQEYSQPAYLREAKALVGILRNYSQKRLGALMDISDKLADLNVKRYRDFTLPFTPQNARQALLAFKGDVYEGLQVSAYGANDFAFAQRHVRILSGLYGLLRPLDLIQPYRLEMGTALPTDKGKNLYQFWGDQVTKSVNNTIAEFGNPILVNLASEEYFKVIRREKVKGSILHVVFKERRGNKLQTIGLLAKKARGRMADYIIRKRLTDAAALRRYAEDGYRFDPELSGKNVFTFVRD
jgi:uncharacterized protein